jgi:acylphosphatase
MPEATRRYLISGKVQGVFFRQGTRVEAERLGLQGMVRNLSNGTVEVVAHGEVAALDALRGWLSHGPSQARVAEVQELKDGQMLQIPVPGKFVALQTR